MLLRVPSVQCEDEPPERGQVKLRPCYPSVKYKDCFKPIGVYCSYAIVDFLFCGLVFVIFYWLVSEVFSWLLVTAAIAPQLVIVQIMVSMRCKVKSDRLSRLLFICVGVPSLISVFYISLALLNYWYLHHIVNTS